MKREGRQHGMVRTYRILPSPLNPKPESRYIQQFDSPPTAGLFTKVPVKPTNHSKFTGRCGRPRCLGCHMHPTCKSKDKTKGNHKLKSGEMVTWRVVDGWHGFKDYGFSASMVLDHLFNDDEVDDDECVVNDGFKVSSQSLGEMKDYEGEVEENIVEHNKDDDDADVKDDGADDDDDVEEGGWCLVGRI